MSGRWRGPNTEKMQCDDVELADVRVRAAEVLGGELRHAVRRGGPGHRILGGRESFRLAVDRGRGA